MLDFESCWKAVAARDRAAEGMFLYGVQTVGVYCRPGCPSRRPRRENAVFFADAAEAEAAGFRPCKRCRPTEAAADARQRRAVEKACRLIAAAERTPTLAELAREVGIARHHFHRLFRRFTGTTPRDYARTVKRNRLAVRLDEGVPVTEAIYAAGYGSPSRVYESADALGMTPATRRRGGRGETIRFAVAGCALGKLLVAATDRGICAVELGDDAAALVGDLRRAFSAAEVVEDEAVLRERIGAILRFIDHPGALPDLPLDIRGTAFQAQVWRALQRIPAGETVSYAALAARLGRPKAARGVARACADNRIALLVPCHRVVGGDGALRGYRWGVERKRALIERERAAGGDETKRRDGT